MMVSTKLFICTFSLVVMLFGILFAKIADVNPNLLVGIVGVLMGVGGGLGFGVCLLSIASEGDTKDKSIDGPTNKEAK
jgi:hypothetical protein